MTKVEILEQAVCASEAGRCQLMNIMFATLN